MLTPELIKKIKKVHIKSGRLVNTLMAGQYRSIFRGSGIEFEEVREYSPGDDVKSIDWKVSARMGRPYIKLYREEREQVLMLLVDMSASQNFGTMASVKRETAAEIACILAFNAIRNNDKVGAILFTDKVETYIPPKKGSSHVWRVIKEIFSFSPEQKGTDVMEAVRFLGRVERKKTIAFLISDFLSPFLADSSDFKPMKSIGRKHELIGVMVSDPGEFTLPPAGIIEMKDFETGESVLMDAGDAHMRKLFETIQKKMFQNAMEAFRSLKIDCIDVSTKGSVADALTRYFRTREMRRR